MRKRKLKVIGWREWVALPELGIDFVKAKVDSGARSSSLHAYDIEPFERGAEAWIRFKLLPIQHRDDHVVDAEARLLENRSVRSSSGRATVRPVIVTTVTLCGLSWPVELTLADRGRMGFRMLLGRQAFRRKFLLDAGRSYCGTTPEDLS